VNDGASAAEILRRISKDEAAWKKVRFRRQRTWFFGDVEGNGVFYHPHLVHYGHQVFEEYFRDRVGLHYADLSRESDESAKARKQLDCSRMTLPVVWCHVHMRSPMYAGDSYEVAVDATKVDNHHVAVRAWVVSPESGLSAEVYWVRVAVLLPSRSLIEIPAWFPLQ